MSSVSVISVLSKKQRKCGVCGLQGHNAKTCQSEKVENTVSESPVTAPSVPTYVTLDMIQKMMNEFRESLKPAEVAVPPSSSSPPAPAPKLSYAATAAAPPPPKPAAPVETVSVSSEEEEVDFRKPLMKLLDSILTRTAVKGATTEWLLLKETYATYPDRFRTIGSGHTSESDPEPHITFVYSHPSTRWNGSQNEPVVFKTWYHIQYSTTETGKWIYKKMTAVHDLCGVKEERTIAVFRSLTW